MVLLQRNYKLFLPLRRRITNLGSDDQTTVIDPGSCHWLVLLAAIRCRLHLKCKRDISRPPTREPHRILNSTSHTLQTLTSNENLILAIVKAYFSSFSPNKFPSNENSIRQNDSNVGKCPSATCSAPVTAFQ